jgi:hypothetical protein
MVGSCLIIRQRMQCEFTGTEKGLLFICSVSPFHLLTSAERWKKVLFLGTNILHKLESIEYHKKGQSLSTVYACMYARK